MLKVSTIRSLIGFAIASLAAACAVPSQTSQFEQKEDKVISGERSPCISMTLKQFNQCGCHPRVAASLDVMDSAGLPETARRELERCISGETQARAKVGGRQIGEIEGALKTCLSQKIEINESVTNSLGEISKLIAARAPSSSEICNWSRCVYGPDAKCEDEG